MRACPLEEVRLTSLPLIRMKSDHDNPGGPVYYLGESWTDWKKRKNFKTLRAGAGRYADLQTTRDLLALEWPRVLTWHLPEPARR